MKVFTDDVKGEITRFYWEYLVPRYVGSGDKYLPYLKIYILERILLQCESKEGYFDKKTKSGNCLNFFKTISKNVLFMERIKYRDVSLYIRNTVEYLKSNRHPDDRNIELYRKMTKRFNREHLLDQLV